MVAKGREEMGAEPVSLDEISIDGGTQQRERIDVDVVSDYAEAMINGEKFPPITLFYDGVTHWPGDGFHRYHASRKAEMLDILAVVHKGTLRDAILFSTSANGRHGLRPTPGDKRKAVTTLLKDSEWTKWSDRAIAEHCHVSHTFVSKLRKEISAESGASAPKLKPKVSSGNVATPESGSGSGNVATPQLKPDETPAPAVPLVIPKRADDPANYDPREDRIAELSETIRTLSRENDHLKDQIAVGLMPTPEIDGTSALETIMALRAQVEGLEIEVAGLKASRDSYQLECSELKQQCKRNRAEIARLTKKAA